MIRKMTTGHSVHYGDLVVILIAGALQPLVELTLGTRASTFYDVFAAIGIAAWVLWRLSRERGLRRVWGIRADNFWSALPIHIAFAAVAGTVIYAWGYEHGNTPLPSSFWYLLLLYPIWGFAQQFALQNLLARNLAGMFPSLLFRSAVAAFLFSLAHAPSMPLMLLSFCAGFVFTILYHRAPNLFAVGIAHGILGALVFHLVLGQNQIEILKSYLVF